MIAEFWITFITALIATSCCGACLGWVRYLRLGNANLKRELKAQEWILEQYNGSLTMAVQWLNIFTGAVQRDGSKMWGNKARKLIQKNSKDTPRPDPNDGL